MVAEQCRAHIGVYRPQDHDPKQDSVSEVLNGVILHIAQTATRHLPDAGQIATHIKPKLGPKLRLSDVYAAAGAIISLAKRLGAHQAARKYYRLASDTLSGQLDAAGIRYTRDMGSLEHPARLRRQPHWPGISEVYCSPKLGIWWRRDAKHHHDILEHATQPGFFQGRGTSCHQSREIGDLPEAELHLVMLTTPTLADSDYGNLDTLAFHYGLTPAQTQALLDGNDIDTGAPPACPPAERCLAICGRL